MAGKFYATTEISYGKKHEDPNDPTKPVRVETKIFKPGDVVSGLSTNEMKQLWNSGALEQREETKSDDQDEEKGDGADAGSTASPTTGASPSGAQTPSGDTSKTPTSPAPTK